MVTTTETTVENDYIRIRDSAGKGWVDVMIRKPNPEYHETATMLYIALGNMNEDRGAYEQAALEFPEAKISTHDNTSQFTLQIDMGINPAPAAIAEKLEKLGECAVIGKERGDRMVAAYCQTDEFMQAYAMEAARAIVESLVMAPPKGLERPPELRRFDFTPAKTPHIDGFAARTAAKTAAKKPITPGK